MNRKPKTESFKPIFAIALAIVLLAVFSVWAQFSGGVDVSFKTDTDTVTIGDPITLTLRIVAPADETVSIPKLETDWGKFEVRAQSAPQITANDDGTHTTVQTIIVALFDVGTFRTPNWDITLTDAHGNNTKRAVPQVAITVQSVLKEGDTDLHDIKPQADMPVPPPWLWILGALLAAALAYFGWKYLRRWLANRRPGTTDTAPAEPIDTRTPVQIALAELARIERLDLPGQGRFKEHYTLVSDCLRQYLENEYHIPALEHTTAEIRVSLRHTSLEQKCRHQFLSLFEMSDLVKFARFIPTPDEAWHFFTDARQLMECLAERERETLNFEP